MTPAGRVRARASARRRRGNIPGTSQATGPDGIGSSGVSRGDRGGRGLAARATRRTRQEAPVNFAQRHIGPDELSQQQMLTALGYASLDELTSAALPAGLAIAKPLRLPDPLPEDQSLAELRRLAAKNQVLTQMIGLGYYDTITPPVIRRNVLESPAWYTAYTPYQPEISQGRLEALLNFQTVIEDLTALPIAGASLLDEGTAAAEAMALAHRVAKKGDTFVVDVDVLPQTLSVAQTRARAIGLDVIVHDFASPLPDGDVFGVLVQYPGASGTV